MGLLFTPQTKILKSVTVVPASDAAQNRDEHVGVHLRNCQNQSELRRKQAQAAAGETICYTPSSNLLIDRSTRRQ